MTTISYLLIPVILVVGLFSIGPIYVLNANRKSKQTLPPRDRLQILSFWVLLLLVVCAELGLFFWSMRKQSDLPGPFISIALILCPFFLGLLCLSKCLFALAGSPPANKPLRNMAIVARYQSWFTLFLTLGSLALSFLKKEW